MGFFYLIMGKTFYFSHDYTARNDYKIKSLLSRHGMEGYGIFWAIIESLYLNANAMPLDYEGIAFDLRTTPEKIQSIVNDFALFVIKDKKVFYSKSVKQRLDERENRSINARESANKRWSQRNATAMRPQCDRNANKVKESKVKENKINNKKLESEFENFRKLYPGTKKGLKIEFQNFLKKVSPENYLKLMPALQREIEWRERAKSAGKFIPEWKHLSTWINNACWEQEFELIENNKNEPKKESYSEISEQVKNEFLKKISDDVSGVHGFLAQ